MARLAVFDIDGTLTDTNAVDDQCFVRAVAEVLELDSGLLDWSAAPHFTDEALLHWLAEHHGRLPLSSHVHDTVVDRFVELLEAEVTASPWRFRPIPGAGSLFQELQRAGWTCALATGGWERSARLKLRAAGLHEAGLAFASSDDALTRVEIMNLAVQRATISGATFDRIVSVGDGVWDVHAATALGWPFVAVASGTRASLLRRQGADATLADYKDVATVTRALDLAKPPVMASGAPLV